MATVNLKVDLDPSGAVKGLSLVGGETRKTGQEASKLEGIFKSVAQGIGQGFGQEGYGALKSVGGAIVGIAASAAEYAGKFQDIHDRTGESVEVLQKYSLVAKAAGTDVEAVAGAAGKLAKNLYEGTDQSVKAVTRLGLSFKDLRNESPDKQMESVLGAIAKLPNPTERSAIALELLGKGGQALVPLGGQMAELSAQAERLGIILDANTIKALDDLGDEVGLLTATWEGLRNQVGGVIASSEPLHVLIGGLTELMGQLTGQVTQNKDGLRSFVDDGVVLAAKGLVGLADVTQTGMNVWDGLQLTWISMKGGIADLGIAVNKYGEIYSKVFLGGLGSDYFKENQVLLEGMKRATAEETDAVVSGSAKRADALGKARAALVGLEKEVEASVGKHHAAAAATDKHGASIDSLGTAAELAAAKAAKLDRAVQESLNKSLAGAQVALAKALSDGVRDPAAKLKAELEAVNAEVQKEVEAGWNEIFDKYGGTGQAIPPEVIGAAQALEEAWKKIGAARTKALTDKDAIRALDEELDLEKEEADFENRQAERRQQWADEDHARKTQELQDWQALGVAVSAFGDTIGGAVGKMFSLGGAAIKTFAGIKAGLEQYKKAQEAGGYTTDQKLQMGASMFGAAGDIYNKGSAGSGAAAGAQQGAAFGPYGALIGAAAGALLGWAGAAQAAHKAADKLRADFFQQAGGLDNLRRQAAAAHVSLEGLLGAKDPGTAQKAIDQINAALKLHQDLIDGIARAVGGAQKIADALAFATPEAADHAAVLFGAAFWAKFKQDGPRAAAEAFGPALAKVREALESKGLSTAFLDPIAQRIQLGQNDAYNSAADLAGGAADVLGGLRQSGQIDQAVVAATAGLSKDLYAQAMGAAAAAGLGPSEAAKAGFQAIGGLLTEQLNDSIRSGQALDAGVQQLIDEARANGIDILADPVVEQLDIAKKQLEALNKIAGNASGGNTGPGSYRDGGNPGAPPPGSGYTTPQPGNPYPDGYPNAPHHARGGFLGGNVLPFPTLGYAAGGLVIPPRTGGWAVAGEAGQTEVVTPVKALYGQLGQMIAGQVVGALQATGTDGDVYLDGELVGRFVRRTVDKGLANDQDGLRGRVVQITQGKR